MDGWLDGEKWVDEWKEIGRWMDGEIDGCLYISYSYFVIISTLVAVNLPFYIC